MNRVTLQEANPELAKQWHPTKNGSLTPKDVLPKSNKKVWWKCDKGHEWQAAVYNRSIGQGCPFCCGKAVCDDNCLATLNPNLAKEWHPTKNLALTPADVTTRSGKKVWWMCNKGHEWQAEIKGRSYGSSCPYCSGRTACNDNCLATLNPNLAKQWHPTKNLVLTPADVTIGSAKKVWWMCKKGHEWQAAVSDRSHGRNCPYCSGKATCDDNCLAVLNPDLAKQWHYKKNGQLIPRNVTTGSHKKVWWICDKGHEWQAAVYDRSHGIGCPYCSAQISQLELRVYCELRYLFPSTISRKKIFGKECDVYIPEIKAGIEVDGLYWHRNRYIQDKKKADAIGSSGITLISVRESGLRRISDADIFYTPKEGALTVIKKIVRALNEQCRLNLNRRKAIDKYLQRQTFANDSEYKKLWDMLPSPFPGLSLLEQRPELAKEWHKNKNGTLLSTDVSVSSSKKVWWMCKKGHEWEATVYSRNAGNGCPYCSGRYACEDNCLSTLNPDLAKQWHPTKNGDSTPVDVTEGSHKRVWWICDKGHEWQAIIKDRSAGTGCPKCRGLKLSKKA